MAKFFIYIIYFILFWCKLIACDGSRPVLAIHVNLLLIKE